MQDAEIRKRILNEATESFMMYGFSRIKMEDIARNIGMSKKTLYLYFDGKDGLIKEVIESKMADINQRMWSNLTDTSKDFIEKLKTFLEILLEINQKLTSELLEDLRKNSSFAWALVEQRRKESIQFTFKMLIEQGMASGVFKKEYPSEVIVRMYLSCMTSILQPDFLLDSKISPQQAFSTIFGVLLEGILTEENRQKLQLQKEINLNGK